jgi:hypothetical protein
MYPILLTDTHKNANIEILMSSSPEENQGTISFDHNSAVRAAIMVVVMVVQVKSA